MITRLNGDDMESSAYLHMQGMPDDFLPSFGNQFLRLIHEGMIQSPYSIPLGLFKNGELKGVIVGATNTQKLLSGIYLKLFLKLIPLVVYKIISQPTHLLFLWQTLVYSSRKPSNIPAELLVLTVDTKVRRKGYGTQLLKALKKEYRNAGIGNFIVGAAHKHKAANQFYQKTGGVWKKDFVMYDHIWSLYEYSI
ncbi:TPA: hypothetical protein DIV55_05145 [Patescibacteria group bacterium]|uniref:N-acetyltransferase domain-containing protein n=1 Tax=Candidatus Gottesmanbacteria bacterium GW2011_GWA1_43_11 TaxID=1618436 RepID=A0A0G1ETA1_9BACT|nr:MAG: hypothetical protein UV59_C0001G0034 [Candidatus Gottesmanbacteria bacterium GW2011_GWA1_43_11]HCS79095.1 hypothetical protein [Patescibacteria group bacterium]